MIQRSMNHYEKAEDSLIKEANRIGKIETMTIGEVKSSNPFLESLNSFKEIGQDIWNEMANRNEKKFDSWYDFGNYMTLGVFDATQAFYEGMKNRAQVATNSSYDFINYVSMGGLDLVKGAVNPENPYSKEHWLNSMGVFALLTGIRTPSLIDKWNETRLGMNKIEAGKTVGEKGKIDAKGTGGSVPKNTIDKLYERTQNIRSDIKIKINEIRNSDEYKNLSNTQRKKLDRKLDLLNEGNVALADVSIPGIKKDFQAHSKIHSSDSVGSDFGNFTHSKEAKSLETYIEDGFPRYNDTEAKILEDIASQIKDPNVSGQINLFTELDACQSCTNLIFEFRRRFPNIKVNIYTKSMR